MDTLKELCLDKSKNNNADFYRFVSSCQRELKNIGSTICFNMEQVKWLADIYDFTYEFIDGYYYLKLKEENKKNEKN